MFGLLQTLYPSILFFALSVPCFSRLFLVQPSRHVDWNGLQTTFLSILLHLFYTFSRLIHFSVCVEVFLFYNHDHCPIGWHIVLLPLLKSLFSVLLTFVVRSSESITSELVILFPHSLLRLSSRHRSGFTSSFVCVFQSCESLPSPFRLCYFPPLTLSPSFPILLHTI
jgi:hypothetical protein